MPANNSSFIQAFLNKTPVSTMPLGDTLLKRVGISIPAAYQLPQEPQITQVKQLCRALFAFEQAALAPNADPAKVQSLSNNITTIANQLNLETLRPSESGVDKDWIIFTPKVNDLSKPLKMPALLIYRFGFVKDKPTNNPNYSVNNLAIVYEHAGQDGDERIVADLFLKNRAKFSLLTVIKPHTVPNPNYDPKKGGIQIKYFTDPAHSTTTIFKPMLETLLQELFREIPVMIMHGMGDPLGLEYQALIGNCYSAYRTDGWRSWANLLAISFGIEDYYTSDANKAADKPSPVISICSEIPNFVLKGGKTVPMSSSKGNGTNGALRWPGGTINTNVTGHIGYFAEAPFTQLIAKGYKQCSDRMLHVELTGFIRSNSSPKNINRDKFVAVVQRALNMYLNYDPAIHDPHKLSKRFPQQAQNMKLYPALFTPRQISRYKRLNKAQYAADSAAYNKLFTTTPQLPPPLRAQTTGVVPLAATAGTLGASLLQAITETAVNTSEEILPGKEETCIADTTSAQNEATPPAKTPIVFSTATPAAETATAPAGAEVGKSLLFSKAPVKPVIKTPKGNKTWIKCR